MTSDKVHIEYACLKKNLIFRQRPSMGAQVGYACQERFHGARGCADCAGWSTFGEWGPQFGRAFLDRVRIA